MPCCPPPPPALATNAVKALSRVGLAMVRGDEVRVTEDIMRERMTICESHMGDCCERVEKPQRVYHRCLKCGCWLDGKFFHKAALATEKCPRNLWAR